MPKVARRFTIITLSMTIFALSFSALVDAQRRTPDLQAGRAPMCHSINLGPCGG